jgi:hypothetical protein
MELELHERKSAASGEVPPFDICSGQWEWTPDSKEAYVRPRIHPAPPLSLPPVSHAALALRLLSPEVFVPLHLAGGSKRASTASIITQNQTGPTGYSARQPHSRCTARAEAYSSPNTRLRRGTLIPASAMVVDGLLLSPEPFMNPRPQALPGLSCGLACSSDSKHRLAVPRLPACAPSPH